MSKKEVHPVVNFLAALFWLFLFFIIYVVYFYESEKTPTTEEKTVLSMEEAITILDEKNQTKLLQEPTKKEEDISHKIAIRAEMVVQILKQKYNIDIVDKKDRHNYNNFYQMETVNDDIEKRVVLDFVAHTASVYTHPKISPQEYLSSCSAIFIALSDIKDKDLSEQILLSMFDDVRQVRKERTIYTSHGVEVTIAPDSTGLLGCEFYKNLND